ncbi:MAG: hypothetical protein QF898_06995 [SAR202 cluster bacterium]|jgi:hypothetical protein|nr:hypothetical protein [SAR202 cluster bacterium]MDP6714597.1 hypothetical protein [SAR202 cluster bacterium]
MSRALKLTTFAIVALALGLLAKPAYAHGFGQRYDLPVPLNMFLIGAGATVALSFVVIGLFVGRESTEFRYPRLNLLKVGVLGPVLSSPVFSAAIGILAVAVFALVLAVGLFGVDEPIDNLSPTFVWIIWWVGMGYVTALVGNIWVPLNPWKIAYEWAQKVLKRDNSKPPRFEYPERLNVWPAALLFFLFAWTENVYTGASRPFSLSILIIIYSAITWAGMAAFGKHQWLRHGEAFTVLFGFFARFSPTEVRVTDRSLCRDCGVACDVSEPDCVDCYQCFERATAEHRELNLRPFAVGLTLPRKVSTATAAFVVLALATVTFDGFQDTPTWINIQNSAIDLAESWGGNPLDTIGTIGLILVPLLFGVVYLGFSWAIRQLAGTNASVVDVARVFVFSLVPIALAYNLAHFISLLILQGQLIIPLISDPFGFDWNILGTADYRLNLNAINARVVWYISVSAIVVGHIVSVYVAHIISLREMPDHASALKSQYPMLALMVSYTATSLWIIAQPIVN